MLLLRGKIDGLQLYPLAIWYYFKIGVPVFGDTTGDIDSHIFTPCTGDSQCTKERSQ